MLRPGYFVSCALDDRYFQYFDAGQISHRSFARVPDGNMH